MNQISELPNMRLTTQRQIILEELSKVKSHPTANEVYDMVRKRLPRIGLEVVEFEGSPLRADEFVFPANNGLAVARFVNDEIAVALVP